MNCMTIKVIIELSIEVCITCGIRMLNAQCAGAATMASLDMSIHKGGVCENCCLNGYAV